MIYRSSIKTLLVLALIAMATGGFLLHIRIHPYSANHSNLVAILSGILSIVVVPLLFSFKKSVSFGYVLNGMLVIIGTITMAHFSLAHLPETLSIAAIFTKTLLADILILWGNFFVGKALFDFEIHGLDPDKPRIGIVYRYPNNGWWAIHLILIACVYWAGHILWR